MTHINMNDTFLAVKDKRFIAAGGMKLSGTGLIPLDVLWKWKREKRAVGGGGGGRRRRRRRREEVKARSRNIHRGLQTGGRRR